MILDENKMKGLWTSSKENVDNFVMVMKKGRKKMIFCDILSDYHIVNSSDALFTFVFSGLLTKMINFRFKFANYLSSVMQFA